MKQTDHKKQQYFPQIKEQALPSIKLPSLETSTVKNQKWILYVKIIVDKNCTTTSPSATN